MIEPVWLETRAVLVLHEEHLLRFGGARGGRRLEGLESALARPLHAFAYGETRMARLAALYAHGITGGHPFTDGNKRSGFLAAATFLAINGLDLVADHGEVFAFCEGLAAGAIDDEIFAA